MQTRLNIATVLNFRANDSSKQYTIGKSFLSSHVRDFIASITGAGAYVQKKTKFEKSLQAHHDWGRCNRFVETRSDLSNRRFFFLRPFPFPAENCPRFSASRARAKGKYIEINYFGVNNKYTNRHTYTRTHTWNELFSAGTQCSFPPTPPKWVAHFHPQLTVVVVAHSFVVCV